MSIYVHIFMACIYHIIVPMYMIICIKVYAMMDNHVYCIKHEYDAMISLMNCLYSFTYTIYI